MAAGAACRNAMQHKIPWGHGMAADTPSWLVASCTHILRTHFTPRRGTPSPRAFLVSCHAYPSAWLFFWEFWKGTGKTILESSSRSPLTRGKITGFALQYYSNHGAGTLLPLQLGLGSLHSGMRRIDRV
jgi:hypothetical protein